MKKSIAMLLGVVALALTTCQKEDSMVFNEIEPSLMKSLALPDDVLENVAYGPEQFIRTAGQPNVYEVSLSSIDFECILPPYVLTVINGEYDGSFRITSGSVYLDGELIFGPSNFKKKVYQLKQEVELTESSTLNIELASKPGSYIHLYVTGEYNEECNNSGTFIDERDGNSYEWVKIGDQVWMAENLAYLPEVNPPTASSFTDPVHYVYGYTGSSIQEAKATSNYQTYGVLYNWHAAMEACPAGWHLPKETRWSRGGGEVSTLISEVSPDPAVKLKALDWDGTDDYGFSALPGGWLSYRNGFQYIGEIAQWWCGTENNTNTSISWRIYPEDEPYGFPNPSTGGITDKADGFSVRCVKD